jgi:hypothetical protein
MFVRPCATLERLAITPAGSGGWGFRYFYLCFYLALAPDWRR